LIILGGGLALHLLSLPWQLYPASALALLILLASLLLYLFGLPTLRQMAFPLAFLLTAVPLPLAEAFGPWLQAASAAGAVALARGIGIPASAHGAQLELGDAQLLVGAPCSGLRSSVTLVTLSLLVIHILEGPLLSKGVLIALSLPLALVANLLRLFTLVGVAHHLGLQAGLSYYHDVSGLLLFLLAFALLLCAARLLRCSEIRADI
jgi:exosortase